MKSLDAEIERVITLMSKLSPWSTEYGVAAKNLELLTSMKNQKTGSIVGVSNDTLVATIANLLGIGLVLGHEKLNVISTKAFTMIAKLRI